MFADLISDYGLWALVASFVVAILAGFVKGAVGFAMPMIMISGIGSFMNAEVAVAALIFPTVVTNLVQAFRGGIAKSITSGKGFGIYLLAFVPVLVIVAQFVTMLPQTYLFAILGSGVVFFGLLQLAGWRVRISPAYATLAAIIFGIASGFFGGLSGVWGPAFLVYLLALDTPKDSMVRVQGLVYGLGALLLVVAHLYSGVLNASTIPYSLLMVLPAFAGQYVGLQVQDRLDQVRFRKLTLIVLVLAGLNLLRRGLLVV